MIHTNIFWEDAAIATIARYLFIQCSLLGIATLWDLDEAYAEFRRMLQAFKMLKLRVLGRCRICTKLIEINMTSTVD